LSQTSDDPLVIKPGEVHRFVLEPLGVRLDTERRDVIFGYAIDAFNHVRLSLPEALGFPVDGWRRVEKPQGTQEVETIELSEPFL
jgi:hypothetical protein